MAWQKTLDVAEKGWELELLALRRAVIFQGTRGPWGHLSGARLAAGLSFKVDHWFQSFVAWSREDWGINRFFKAPVVSADSAVCVWYICN